MGADGGGPRQDDNSIMRCWLTDPLINIAQSHKSSWIGTASKAFQIGLSLHYAPTLRDGRDWNNIICSELSVRGRNPMDDYSGRLNFLALVGAALLLCVVVIGFRGHDNGQMEDIITASIVAPAIAQAKQ